jgi:DNA adenine methylase
MSLNEPLGYVGQHTQPPLAYPGNKAKIAPQIISHIPEHETYVEPFGGTAGVLFNKKPSKNEVINDLDNDLYTFIKVLKNQPEDLQEWLRAQPYSQSLYEEWNERWRDGWKPRKDVAAAGIYFFLRRASFGADRGGFRAEANGRKFSPRQFANAIDRIPELSERLADVLLLNQDYEEVIRKYAGDGTFIYMDPPYKDALHRYKASLFSRPRFCNLLAELSGGDIDDGKSDWLLSCASIPMPLRSYPHTETDCHHEINNQDGSKEVTEKLVMSYNIKNRSQFTGTDQEPLTTFADHSQ